VDNLLDDFLKILGATQIDHMLPDLPHLCVRFRAASEHSDDGRMLAEGIRRITPQSGGGAVNRLMNGARIRSPFQQHPSDSEYQVGDFRKRSCVVFLPNKFTIHDFFHLPKGGDLSPKFKNIFSLYPAGTSLSENRNAPPIGFREKYFSGNLLQQGAHFGHLQRKTSYSHQEKKRSLYRLFFLWKRKKINPL
jgi:hypothetical protein